MMNDTTMGDAANALGAHSKDTVSGLRSEAAAQTHQQAESAGELLQDTTDRLAEIVRERPVTSLLAAVAVGWLIGRIGRYI